MSGRTAPIRTPFLAAALLCLLAPALEASWYDADWVYRKELTVNGALVTGAQTNFPVLVSWTTDSDVASRAQNDGDDILFTSSDGVTKLDHEIESFDGTTGALAPLRSSPGRRDVRFQRLPEDRS